MIKKGGQLCLRGPDKDPRGPWTEENVTPYPLYAHTDYAKDVWWMVLDSDCWGGSGNLLSGTQGMRKWNTKEQPGRTERAILPSVAREGLGLLVIHSLARTTA